MEDMARLGVIEQNVGDPDKFRDILYEILRHLNTILENPHDYALRVITGDALQQTLEYVPLVDYLKYLGFLLIADTLVYPKESSLNKLRLAQATIMRKLCLCFGSVDQKRLNKGPLQIRRVQKPQFVRANILKTTNPFLLKIERLFNDMIKYEDEKLLERARSRIPLVTLQMMAIETMRGHQRKMKTGEVQGKEELPFDIALLMEFVAWFKHRFFSWVDKPPCTKCKGATMFRNTTSLSTDYETCSLEIYECIDCQVLVDFPRYNDPHTLLKSRRGRCGEWANCFTLMARALGYDTRYVYDVTDHVWCEVFDYDSNRWLHVDPCEGKIDSPLLYSVGWGKKLSYVIAVSIDDIQDVTWRYTNNHKEVLARRTQVSESELLDSILKLREYRQRQVSEARRKYLAKRAVLEVVQMMAEKKPEDYECHGRTTGSKEWRTTRGEMGSKKCHTFEFTQPGAYQIQYYPGRNKYKVFCDGKKIDDIPEWARGVYRCSHVAMKVEMDWKMVYLARDEDSSDVEGLISWRLSTSGDTVYKKLSIGVTTALYDTGRIDWRLKFDDLEPIAAELGETPTTFEREFTEVIILAILTGGTGDLAWQHAQLCRKPVGCKDYGLEIAATLDSK